MESGAPLEQAEVTKSAATGPSPRSPGLSRHVGVGMILGESWARFKAAWPACMLIYWGGVAVSWMILLFLTLTLASLNAVAADPQVTPFLEFLQFVGRFLVPAWIWIGQTIGFLKIARREPVRFDDLFRGAPWLLTFLLAAGVLVAVAALPCLLIYAASEAIVALRGGEALGSMIISLWPTTAPGLVVPWEGEFAALVLITLGVVVLWYLAFLAVTVRLGQFAYLVIDQGAGVLESHRTSWRMTRGHSATVFLIYLAQFALNLAGLLMCYVGIFFTLPLTSLLSAVLFQVLQERHEREFGEPGASAASST